MKWWCPWPDEDCSGRGLAAGIWYALLFWAVVGLILYVVLFGR